MRRAFTLLELLVVVAIMATMVTVGVVNLGASRGSTQVFGATRDVMAMIRRARSLALVKQEPVVLVYSNSRLNDEAAMQVTIQKAEGVFAKKNIAETVQTLSGEIVSEIGADTDDEKSGETIEEILSPETLPADVTVGLKIRVLDETDTLNLPENEMRRSKISIFSTAANVSRTLTAATPEKNEAAPPDETAESEFKVAFAVNGTVNPPHRIWIYRDGEEPEKGISIRVDRFGEPKCEDFE